jgi:hypothetical protein
MQEFKMIDALPSQTLDGGTEFLNRLHWNISVKTEQGIRTIFAGHKVLLKTDSKDSADAFLYGLALAFSTMPSEALEVYRRIADKFSK